MLQLAAVLALSAVAGPAAPSREAAAVEAALQAACRAFRDGDVRAVEDFLAPGVTFTDTRGRVGTREDVLAEVRAREPRYDVFENRDMKVRLYGDTAVVNGITVVKGTANGQPFAAELQFTDTLVKTDGRWRIVATHVSPVALPAAR